MYTQSRTKFPAWKGTITHEVFAAKLDHRQRFRPPVQRQSGSPSRFCGIPPPPSALSIKEFPVRGLYTHIAHLDQERLHVHPGERELSCRHLPGIEFSRSRRDEISDAFKSKAKPSKAKQSQANQSKPDQTRSDQVRSDQTREQSTEQSRAEQRRAEQSKANKTKSKEKQNMRRPRKTARGSTIKSSGFSKGPGFLRSHAPRLLCSLPR